MAIWSVYVAPSEEKFLKKKIQVIADKKRWSFSQAVSEILKEHLVEGVQQKSDEQNWEMLSARSFFEGYSDKDSVYDQL